MVLSNGSFKALKRPYTVNDHNNHNNHPNIDKLPARELVKKVATIFGQNEKTFLKIVVIWVLSNIKP